MHYPLHNIGKSSCCVKKLCRRKKKSERERYKKAKVDENKGKRKETIRIKIICSRLAAILNLLLSIHIMSFFLNVTYMMDCLLNIICICFL